MKKYIINNIIAQICREIALFFSLSLSLAYAPVIKFKHRIFYVASNRGWMS